MRGMSILMALLLVGGMSLGIAGCGTPVPEEIVEETVEEAIPTVELVVEAPTIEVVEEPVVTTTVLSVLEADGRFTKLVELLGTAGLTETLAGEGPFTVFAPTDEAFAEVEATLAELDAEGVKAILLGHVANQMLYAADVLMLADTELEMADGSLQMVTVDGEDVLLGDAMVTEPDIDGGNGIIHVIDVVLVPMAEAETE